MGYQVLREPHRLVAAHRQPVPAAGQFGDRLGDAGKQGRHRAGDGRVVVAVRGHRLGRVGRGHEHRHQVLQPVPDVPRHLGFGQRRQAVQPADVVGAGGDGGEAVGEGAVEIEQGGANGHDCLRTWRTDMVSGMPTGPAARTPPTARSLELTPEQVFREYAPRIYHIARRMLGNDADAEDVTQDVLLQVVRKLDTFRGDAQISDLAAPGDGERGPGAPGEAGEPGEAGSTTRRTTTGSSPACRPGR